MRISECICNRITMKKNIDFLTHLQEKLPLIIPSPSTTDHSKVTGDCFDYFIVNDGHFEIIVIIPSSPCLLNVIKRSHRQVSPSDFLRSHICSRT